MRCGRAAASLVAMVAAVTAFVGPATAYGADRATTVLQGQWFNGSGTTACDGSLTNLTCEHSATSSQAVVGASVCFEAVAGTGVGSLGCSASLSGTSVGIGRRDLSCATRPVNPLTTNGTLEYYSPTLQQSFSIRVKIFSDAGTTYFQGTGNFPLGTAHVEGSYSAGCDVEGVTNTGPFSGTFTLALVL